MTKPTKAASEVSSHKEPKSSPKPAKAKQKKPDAPFETKELRAELKKFFDKPEPELYGQKLGESPLLAAQPLPEKVLPRGSFKCGVYAFYDYDDEPIYVGQTREKLRGRIGRHLTNQRTDAVAMRVLDPFEVYKVEIWPVPHFENFKSLTPAEKIEAERYLNALERTIYDEARETSKFKAVLNEKIPPELKGKIEKPKSYSGVIVSSEVKKIRGNPDTRIARRTATLASLAQIVSEREVDKGLRQTLETQAHRLVYLATERLKEFSQEPMRRSKADDD